MAGFIAQRLIGFITIFACLCLSTSLFMGVLAGIPALELGTGFFEEGEGVTEVGSGAVVEGVGLEEEIEMLDEVGLLEEALGRRVFGEIGRGWKGGGRFFERFFQGCDQLAEVVDVCGD